MRTIIWMTLALAVLNIRVVAQEYVPGPMSSQEYIGSPTPSASEPLFKYDDLEVWKHGWIQINPYEHGYQSYRPYNYKHVLSQAAQSAVWGMPSTMPYSQSYYLRHGHLTGINGEPLPPEGDMTPVPSIVPTPGIDLLPGPTSSQNMPAFGAPSLPRPAYGMPMSTIAPSPLRAQPFSMNLSARQFNDLPGLTQLPGHQFVPQSQPQVHGSTDQRKTISPANFQQLHQNAAAGPEFQRELLQRAQIQQLLQQGQPQLPGPSLR